MGRGENRSHRMQLDAARQEYERKHTVCDDFVVTGYRAPGGTRGSRESPFFPQARENVHKSTGTVRSTGLLFAPYIP